MQKVLVVLIGSIFLSTLSIAASNNIVEYKLHYHGDMQCKTNSEKMKCPPNNFRVHSASYDTKNKTFQFTILKDQKPLILPSFSKNKTKIEQCYLQKGKSIPRDLQCKKTSYVPKNKNTKYGRTVLNLTYNPTNELITMNMKERVVGITSQGKYKTQSMSIKNITFKPNTLKMKIFPMQKN